MRKILGHAVRICSRAFWVKERCGGFTLIELLTVVAIIGTLAGIAIPTYSDFIEKAKIAKAIAEISILQKEIAAYEGEESDNFLPNTLNDIGRGNLLDPWGNAYQYLNFATIAGGGVGGKRMDQFTKPLNTDYDLYSMGKDGETQQNLTGKKAHDDIVRGNDGRFIGLAWQY
jgi:general secretion pathway protein G